MTIDTITSYIILYAPTVITAFTALFSVFKTIRGFKSLDFTTDIETLKNAIEALKDANAAQIEVLTALTANLQSEIEEQNKQLAALVKENVELRAILTKKDNGE